ncbi:MAG TPA: peptidylprolyl isomerase [Steroidobacteraceae bacterium]|nr:peptidylprolyl isomerase [Steroidobacteraceae bacterium]
MELSSRFNTMQTSPGASRASFQPRLARGAAVLVSALVCLLAGALAHAQTRDLATKGALLDRIAAIVNDGVVLSSELDAEVALVAERLQQQKLELPPQNVLRQQVLERLIVQEIEMQRANHAGIKVPDEALNNALQEVAQRNKLTLSQLPEALASQGVDYASYRDAMRKELTLTLLRQRDVLQHISVTSREIDQYLEKQSKHPADNEYNISHILIAVPENATPEQLEQASKRAQDVYERAKSGEDFAKLAVSFSNSQTALEGGALGWRKGTELPTFLSDVVLKMKAGDVSAPMRAPTGFHIVKLNDIRGTEQKVVVDQVHARHILMRPNELQDDATVRQKLEQLRARIMNGEDFAGLAKISSEDPGSASDGGDLGWSSPGTFAPEFEKELDKLQENEISEPFRTQYGWHIVQLLGRRRFDSTDELKRKHAVDEIRASKADEQTELWLRQLRDDAYVEYKL